MYDIDLKGDRVVSLVFKHEGRRTTAAVFLNQKLATRETSCYTQGDSDCSPKDNFSKFDGRRRALRRALARMNRKETLLDKDDRRVIWWNVLSLWRWPGRSRLQHDIAKEYLYGSKDHKGPVVHGAHSQGVVVDDPKKPELITTPHSNAGMTVW